MMRRTMILALAMTMGCQAAPADEAGLSIAPQDVLKTLQPAHPRLMLTDARLEEIHTLSANDSLLANCLEQVMKQAVRALRGGELKHYPNTAAHCD